MPEAADVPRRRPSRLARAAALSIAIAAPGCASLGPTPEYAKLARANLEARGRLEYGLSRAEARARMGTGRVAPPWKNSRGIGPERVDNPLDSVEFESPAGDAYAVDRYAVALTGDPRCPFVRGHADLIPLIYYDGALVGWDWEYLENTLQRRLEPEERSFGFGQFCDPSDAAAPPD